MSAVARITSRPRSTARRCASGLRTGDRSPYRARRRAGVRGGRLPRCESDRGRPCGSRDTRRGARVDESETTMRPTPPPWRSPACLHTRTARAAPATISPFAPGPLSFCPSNRRNDLASEAHRRPSPRPCPTCCLGRLTLHTRTSRTPALARSVSAQLSSRRPPCPMLHSRRCAGAQQPGEPHVGSRWSSSPSAPTQRAPDGRIEQHAQHARPPRASARFRLLTHRFPPSGGSTRCVRSALGGASVTPTAQVHRASVASRTGQGSHTRRHAIIESGVHPVSAPSARSARQANGTGANFDDRPLTVPRDPEIKGGPFPVVLWRYRVLAVKFMAVRTPGRAWRVRLLRSAGRARR
jgi:hypothetical protein